jgi:hypothetical protein
MAESFARCLPLGTFVLLDIARSGRLLLEAERTES